MSFKTKIQLFILPLLLAYLIFFFYGEYFKPKKTIENKPKKVVQNFSGNYIDIFSKIETYAKAKKIDIVNISKEKKIIKLLAKSSLAQSKHLIRYIENLNKFAKIQKFNLVKIENKSSYLYEVNISFENYYDKELKQINIETNKEKSTFKLSAIIDSFAIINDKLISVDEKINGYVLVNIKMNYVQLKKDNEILKVELIHNESK